MFTCMKRLKPIEILSEDEICFKSVEKGYEFIDKRVEIFGNLHLFSQLTTSS